MKCAETSHAGVLRPMTLPEPAMARQEGPGSSWVLTGPEPSSERGGPPPPHPLKTCKHRPRTSQLLVPQRTMRWECYNVSSILLVTAPGGEQGNGKTMRCKDGWEPVESLTKRGARGSSSHRAHTLMHSLPAWWSDASKVSRAVSEPPGTPDRPIVLRTALNRALAPNKASAANVFHTWLPPRKPWKRELTL